MGNTNESLAAPGTLAGQIRPAAPPTLNKLAAQIHQNAADHGFWDKICFAEKIALIHSELSEALEEDRGGRPDVWHSIGGHQVYRATDGSGADWTTDPDGGTPLDDYTRVDSWTGVKAKPEGVAVELVDALIRILDQLGYMRVDIDGLVAEKMAYNADRPIRHGKNY